MKTAPFSDEVAFRIALATRSLPGLGISDLIQALQKNLGDDISEDSLSKITVTNLKTAVGQTYNLDGEEDGEDSRFSLGQLKEAVRLLWGETPADDETALNIKPYVEGEIPDSIRVALASNSLDQLDGHFGSCTQFLVYQVSATDKRLIDVRSTSEAESAEDKNAFRASLIKDCHVLYVVSIGGPAAAKVIKAGIYPMKIVEGGTAEAALENLQKVMATSPPPWLAKILGVSAQERVKNYKAQS